MNQEPAKSIDLLRVLLYFIGMVLFLVAAAWLALSAYGFFANGLSFGCGCLGLPDVG